MKKGVAYGKFRELVLAFPGVEEGIAYGTPIFKVKKKMVARQWDEPEIVVVKIDFALRSTLTSGAPETFFTTPHHEPSPLVLVRLPNVLEKDLQYLLEQAWRMVAAKRLIEEFDKNGK